MEYVEYIYDLPSISSTNVFSYGFVFEFNESIVDQPNFIFRGLEKWKDEDQVDFESNGLNVAYVRDKLMNEDDVVYYQDAKSDYLVAFYDDVYNNLSCNWQHLINTNYTAFAMSLQRLKKISRYYLLTAVDIASLDLFKLVYDSGSYYMINSIENYIPGRTTKVELFKVG